MSTIQILDLKTALLTMFLKKKIHFNNMKKPSIILEKRNRFSQFPGNLKKLCYEIEFYQL